VPSVELLIKYNSPTTHQQLTNNSPTNQIQLTNKSNTTHQQIKYKPILYLIQEYLSPFSLLFNFQLKIIKINLWLYTDRFDHHKYNQEHIVHYQILIPSTKNLFQNLIKSMSNQNHLTNNFYTF